MTEIVNITDPILSIHDFMIKEKVDIDKLYIDRFWSSIEDETMILIDDVVIRWMGYEANELFSAKQSILKLLNRMKNVVYEHVNHKELTNREDLLVISISAKTKSEEESDLAIMDRLKNPSSNNIKYLFVDSDTFKNICMRLGTDRGNQVRTMYINLEKLYKKYIKYSQVYHSQLIQSNKKALENNKKALEIERISHENTKLELKTKADALKEEENRTLFWKDRVENKIPLKANKYIYVVADPIHAKEGIYKLGHTEDPYSRLSSYNTRSADLEDKFTYLALYQSINSQAVEKLLFSLLANFRLNGNKEFLKIPLEVLKSVCNDLLMTEKRIVNKINHFLETNEYEEDNYGNADMSHDFIYDEENRHIGKIKCKICDKLVGFCSFKKHLEKCEINNEQKEEPELELDSLKEVKKRRKRRTTESINNEFIKYNIRLKEPYNKIYEAPQKFICLSKFKHEFETSVDNMKDCVKHEGCPKCRKYSIVNNIPLYSYKSDMTYDKSFKDMEELKSQRITNYQLIRNNIREMRWLCPVNGYIYSILEPDKNNKLNLNRPLTDIEETIIKILEIDYDALKQYFDKKNEYVYAIDEDKNHIYRSTNLTAFSRSLAHKTKPRLTVNRKTIPKYVDGTKKYAGYLWKSTLPEIYKNWKITEYY